MTCEEFLAATKRSVYDCTRAEIGAFIRHGRDCKECVAKLEASAAKARERTGMTLPQRMLIRKEARDIIDDLNEDPES